MLTKSGLGSVVTAVVLVGLGMWWNYEELIVGGIAITMIVLAAVWVARRPLRAHITRRLTAVRVPRGDPIRLTYRVRNTSRFRTGRATIVDYCDSAESRTALDPVAPNTVRDVTGQIATRRRGLFDVGPFDVARIDPCYLAVGLRRDDAVSTVTVHPKVYHLVGPQGAVRVVENESVLRRSSADPMSGFVSLREYVVGDDPRLIHWPTSARTGTLMIREHVEVRRPEFTIVLDAARSSSTANDFEEAVDVAATLAAHAIRSGLDVIVRTTSRAHAGRPTPIIEEGEVLDLLTPVQLVDEADLLTVGSLFVGGFDHTSVVVVTGPEGPSSRLAALERMIVVRIGDDAATAPGVAVAAANAPEFVTRWRSWV